jgi:hypothetical protein
MCGKCHTELTQATSLINTALDRHMRRATTTELQLTAEAVRDTNILDRHLADLTPDNGLFGDRMPLGGAVSDDVRAEAQISSRLDRSA